MNLEIDNAYDFVILQMTGTELNIADSFDSDIDPILRVQITLQHPIEYIDEFLGFHLPIKLLAGSFTLFSHSQI